MRERAKDKVREILDSHRPRYIEEDKAREIDAIAAAAQAEVGKIQKVTRGLH